MVAVRAASCSPPATTTPPLRPRWIAQHVLDALEDTPVVAIVGPRRAGKSRLVASITAERPGWTSWTLDDLNILERALADPAGLIAGTSGPVTIDEVQRAPKLLLAIKAAVDRDRRPGRFLLTGSADVFALPRYGDALTGRVEVAPLRPFSQGELEGVREDFVRWAFGTERPPTPPPLEDLAERVLRGGFPPAVARATARRRRAWFDAYLATSLQRDVHDVAQLTWSEVGATLHHYREHDGAEVDLLLEASDGRIVGIEVEAGQRVESDAARHLAALRDALGDRFARGVVLHAGPTVLPLGDRLWALPISALWTAA